MYYDENTYLPSIRVGLHLINKKKYSFLFFANYGAEEKPFFSKSESLIFF